MNLWRHPFVDGEHPDRQRILGGLALKDVSAHPHGATRSVCEGLWHISEWQDIVLSGDGGRRDSWSGGGGYPAAVGPPRQGALEELGREFLTGPGRAQESAQAAEASPAAAGAGGPSRDELMCLAVRNAYHPGKIVALRRQPGCWPEQGQER